MVHAAVPDILKGANIAPMLVEASAKLMRPLAQELAEAWTPSLLIEDSSPDFRQQLETAVTEGFRVIFVVDDAKSISGYIQGVRYARKGMTQMVSVNRNYVDVHESFRLCLVLKEGVSTWADPWREAMNHWLYRNATLHAMNEIASERLHGLRHAPQTTKPDLTQQSRVFVSYSHRDREAANKIALELSRSKMTLFIDHWEMNSNDRILERIEKELCASDYIVILLSSGSAASFWVQPTLFTSLVPEGAITGRRSGDAVRWAVGRCKTGWSGTPSPC